MREIKFRGRSAEYGDWLYGDLLNGLNDEFYIRHVVTNGTKSVAVESIIEKETLGQYTELKDKDKVEIYEGDICKPVGMGMKHFETGVASLYKKQNHYAWLPNGASHNYTDGEDWKVIGNIHQHPELIKN